MWHESDIPIRPESACGTEIKQIIFFEYFGVSNQFPIFAVGKRKVGPIAQLVSST